MIKRTVRKDSRANSSDAAPPDQAARDVITGELDKNLLVEAAAGTGKTTSLVARMINLIRQDKCPIENLAAVTFTRKAASELRSRFQVGLEKAAGEASGIEKDRLARAVEHVERTFLGTIHSFCARLLRERPVEAGVDLEFSELDEAQDSELRARAWSEHVARMVATSNPLVGELDHLGVELGDLSQAFERITDYPDVDEWPAPEVPLPDAKPIVTALENFVAHIKSLDASLPEDWGNDKLIPAYRKLRRSVRQADLESPAELLTVLEPFLNAKPPDVVQKIWPGGKAQAIAEQEAWTRFGENYARAYVQTLRRARYAVVMKSLRPAVEIYDRLRRDAALLNFQDLLLAAARLLRENPVIRTYFRNRFTHLLIDEFQDTDPIQAEVMMLLVADDPTVIDWHQSHPVSGSLFVVGDPKQSIYRFRRADIVTYNEVKRIIQETGGEVVSLTANFRATAPLVDWVNSTFSDRFPGAATEVAPAYSLLDVGRVDERAGDYAGLYRLPSVGENKQAILASEPRILARTIRHAIATGRKIPRSKREHDAPDGAQPGDFLIVTRNTKNLSGYAGELQALGVPHQVTGGTSLNELPELALLGTCLRALIRPDDPIALVAALRSELFGISDLALYELKQAGGKFAFHEPIPAQGLSPYHSEAIACAFDRLRLYDGWLYHLPAAASIERIADDSGLMARAASAPGGDVRAGSLAKAFELLRAAQVTQLSTLELLGYLDRLVKGDQKHDGITVRPDEGSSVRLMNLHKVKGLEAPVVFLADPTGNYEHPIDLHIDRAGKTVRGYLAVYAPRPEGSLATPRPLALPSDWAKQEDIETGFLEAENQRLLYVAATRAGTCLVVSERSKRPKDNPWHSLAEALGDREPQKDPGAQVAPPRPQVSVAIDDVLSARDEIDRRWMTLRQPTFDARAIKEMALKEKQVVSDRERGAILTPAPPEASEEPEDEQPGEAGVAWGEDVHELLEAAMRGRDAGLENLARSLTRERDGIVDEDKRMQDLLECVRSVRQSEIWKRAQKSQQVLPEVPIMMMDKSAERSLGRPLLLRGVIDLAFREPEGWVIVDYKTDKLKEKSLTELVEQYRPQVQSYADAWALLLKEPVHETGLFFTRANRYERLNGAGD
jgi:ATP-dependent helicase/nuclease subunit A